MRSHCADMAFMTPLPVTSRACRLYFVRMPSCLYFPTCRLSISGGMMRAIFCTDWVMIRSICSLSKRSSFSSPVICMYIMSLRRNDATSSTRSCLVTMPCRCPSSTIGSDDMLRSSISAAASPTDVPGGMVTGSSIITDDTWTSLG